MADIEIRNFTKRRMPLPPFVRIAKEALPGWDISLSFVGKARAKSLNQKLRNKNYVPNVLSYEVGKKSGEIIICLDVLEKEAPTYNLEPRTYCLYLFIHGLMHLKGHPHGPTMEKRERELMSRLVHVHSTNEKASPRNRN